MSISIFTKVKATTDRSTKVDDDNVENFYTFKI